jgi:hypothetical protein
MSAIWEGNESGQVGLLNFPLLQGTTGYTAKFSVARQLYSALNPALGGGTLPGPDAAMVGAVQHLSTPKTTTPSKTTPKTSAPTKSTGKGGGHGKGH